MLLNYKKAISGYILVLLITSFIISVFFISTLGKIYGEDNILCKKIKFKVKKICRLNNQVKLQVENNYNNSIQLLINGYTDPSKYRIKPNKDIFITYNLAGKQYFDIIPKSSDKNGFSFECKSLKKSYNVEILKKC